ncbi:MAG: hypothetical protein LKI88_00725 [Bifidobacterium sp.]|jgi:hypothetical protein|nr:hypothetical protein [Bifidobacterium sp.]MCI1864454.1 hypothetical protein [Bifidobacterium sp.]
MKITKIVTAKIERDVYSRIDAGQKHYEVRSESFDGASIIRYVASDDLQLLGIRELGVEQEFERESDEFVLSLAGVSESDFYKLFPHPNQIFSGLPSNIWRLYAARIGERVYDINEYISDADAAQAVPEEKKS